MCEGLSRQMQRLADLVERQHQSGGDLLERTAAANGGVFPDRKTFSPSLDMVSNQVNHPAQIDNYTLCTLAIGGDKFARRERLLREIMQVDKVSWDDAHETLIEMDNFNERYYWLQTFPYRIGITMAIVCTIGSIVLVFDKTIALKYGVEVAGEHLPDDIHDISEMTTNQVGTWTWSWMEPMIGTASFVLLCMQFGRAQCTKMNMLPYTEAMLRMRAKRLEKAYPQYCPTMVRCWAVTMPKVDTFFFPKYKNRFYTPEARYQNFRSGV